MFYSCILSNNLLRIKIHTSFKSGYTGKMPMNLFRISFDLDNISFNFSIVLVQIFPHSFFAADAAFLEQGSPSNLVSRASPVPGVLSLADH